MKFSVVAAALASTSAVYGHAIMQKIYVNGVDQGAGLGSYIRNVQSNSPVKDVTSKNIICNVDRSVAPKTIEVSSGDVITMQWWHNTPNDDIIDPTHKGPLMVYIAPTSSNGAGAVWTKIFNQGYTDGWATDKLIAAKGLHSITVPDLAAGEYLIRPEIVALHEADTSFAANSARGAQFYMSCAQIKVVSTGSVKLGSGIDFNKDYTPTGTGILFNLYGGPALTSYVAPGGDVSSIAVSSQAGIGPIPAVGSKPTTQATSAAASTSAAAPTTTAAAPSTTAAPATSAAQTTSALESTSVVESTSAPVPTTTAVASSTRAPLPTSKFTTVTVRSSSAAAATPSACPTTGAGTGSGAAVKKWYQCGGINYTGSTVCESGSSCVVQNPYYSQCL